MLSKIEAELFTAAEPDEKQWLRQRAELIRRLLAPRQSPIWARRCGGIAL
jgi:hypothetical protein